MSTSSVCAACGGHGLSDHLRVAGELGAGGLIPSTDQFGTALGDIARCPRCGHMQLDPMPAATMLADAYATAASEDYVQEELGQRETARRALERIEAYAPPVRPRALLDLGCWVGFLLAEARERGWDTLGVEPSAFAAGYARDRLGLTVVQGELLEAELPAGAFHAITLGDVIEHVTDPLAALRRIDALLAPGGVVWLALPDAGSRMARALGRRWWSVIPTHVQYFTRGSIAALLRRGGFEPVEVTTAPKAFTVRYYLERIGGYSPPLARGLVTAAGRAGVADRLWAPDFRDRMAVVARRASAR
ncbi:MAG TPA: class I SAM-dependent methyltransferase [Solirubrobacteraceae bacterium]|nr:class I SAM-dependent methyltransferase [Solirubrobacteraceae bacterium]